MHLFCSRNLFVLCPSWGEGGCLLFLLSSFFLMVADMCAGQKVTVDNPRVVSELNSSIAF